MTIVVVGSLHLDLMVQTAALPRLGETVLGSAWQYKPGGKGGNQAVAAARHEARLMMLGLVGADDFGVRLRNNLRAEGVDDSGVLVRAEAGSGISVAITEMSGDYGAVIVSGVNLLLDASVLALQASRLAGCSWLLLQNEVPEAANIAAAEMARAGGGRVLLNAAPARPLPDRLVAEVDILVVNALEAAWLYGRDVDDLATAEAAAAHLAKIVPWAVVTAGGAGIAAAGPDGMRLVLPAHPVQVVSTHGAGDAFVGALAARLDAGEAMGAAIGYANAAAALTVATLDDARAQIGPDQVRQFMQRGTGAS